MFKEKQDSQIFEEEKNGEKKYNREDLPEGIELKMEIDGKTESMSKELGDAVLLYLLNKKKIKGLQKGERYSLCLRNEDLTVEYLDEEGEIGFAWCIEDEEIEHQVGKTIKLASVENKENPKDVSKEFLELSAGDFSNKFLRDQRNESALSIKIYWDDDNEKLSKYTLIRLKAFLEDSDALGKQKRFAVVIGTKEQESGEALSHSHSRNAFASGVKFIEI